MKFIANKPNVKQIQEALFQAEEKLEYGRESVKRNTKP